MIAFIKKYPILTASSAFVLIAGGILLYQYSFFTGGIKGVRNTIDCKKITSKKRSYDEKLAACKSLVARDPSGNFKDSLCLSLCEQILDCEKVRTSNSISDLRRFLNKYDNASKVDCYLEVHDRLDALVCDEARNAPDTVRRLSLQQYLDEFGASGLCSAEISAELEECETILASDSCSLLYDYLYIVGEEGACYFEVSKKYYDICVSGPTPYVDTRRDSTAYANAKAADDCEAYKKYLLLHPNGRFKDEILALMRQNCPDTPVPYESNIAALAVPVRPQDASEDGGRINTTTSLRAKSPSAGCKTYTVGGMTFQAVKIGPLLVMCENLNVPMFNSVCYNYDAYYCQQYGELYSYPEALAACPRGWRLPCQSEIDFLISTYYSNPQRAFENMSHHTKMQFGGLAAGNTFMNAGQEAYFWCATEASDTEAYYYKFDNWQKTVVNGDVLDKTYKMSCRCVSVADEREYVASRISRIRCHNEPN